jgi:uncharacterized membrane protein
MKPLYVLLLAFFVSIFMLMVSKGEYDYAQAGKIAMSVMLIFASFGHFFYYNGMTMMLPDFIPFKRAVVVLTGVIEIAAAIGFLVQSVQQLTAIMLIIFFIVILPANIKAALKNIDYQKASYEGPGVRYLWLRVPLQLFFIAWVWFFVFFF